MILVTAGNKVFANFIKRSVKVAEKLNYQYQVYDLGDLGFGTPCNVINENFNQSGYYCSLANGTWQTKALHKPKIILDALLKNDFVVYLDADAMIVKNVDELLEGNYDVGVTIRRPIEIAVANPQHKEIMGSINAGVCFFRHSQKTLNFLQDWTQLTESLRNDQFALNQLVNPNKLILKPNETFKLNQETIIKTWSGDVYNFYYFPENPAKAKIIHYKGDKWKVPTWALS